MPDPCARALHANQAFDKELKEARQYPCPKFISLQSKTKGRSDELIILHEDLIFLKCIRGSQAVGINRQDKIVTRFSNPNVAHRSDIAHSMVHDSCPTGLSHFDGTIS